MKKRKIEILLTVLLSLAAWIYFVVFSKKLDEIETIFVFGVFLLIVFAVGSLIRKYKKKDEKK